ncbi:MAG: 16S rRNA (uracil(1498)-N(3))-methyltransferase [Polaromonas sp.]|nr:16S rRNA (uracil(1498)-N(3))-methyltransferase [Polaromonas sp.]
MSARFYADIALVPGQTLTLPDQAARHVQVLRLQPGDAITLFNGRGHAEEGAQGSTEGEFAATVVRMGRSDVDVLVGAYLATEREARRAIHLAVCMPANDRMDWLIEKATELGAASIQPLMSERSVLRLKSERADKKLAHWRAAASAACEQCWRNRVPLIHEVLTLADWLKKSATPDMAQTAGAAEATASAARDATGNAEAAPPVGGTRLLLSLQPGSRPLAEIVAGSDSNAFTFLNGPEGGLSPAEEAAALACGFAPVTLGPRVLRAETAPLACLALLTLA